MHDGRCRALPRPCPRATTRPTARGSRSTCASARARGEIVTGLLYVDEGAADVHALNHTPARALQSIPLAELCPGAAELAALQADFR